MSGLNEIYKFMEEWRDKKNFNVLLNGNLQFSASVIYSSPRFGNESSSCLVMVERTGLTDGDITIIENGPLKSESHHLGFKEQYQTYKFDEGSKALIIKGDSSKMGGAYTVSLIPDGKKVNWKPR